MIMFDYSFFPKLTGFPNNVIRHHISEIMKKLKIYYQIGLNFFFGLEMQKTLFVIHYLYLKHHRAEKKEKCIEVQKLLKWLFATKNCYNDEV